ncbi:hypothetical protein BT63DRAFT_436407 [Microthyrium microscopicum]|uniref:Uncharacterized protein n=1 Tax=Microthyrium microscopicum TaxID=703497 RepID=A0A6A6UUS5_9PEZI|nr:hypothetical protein BT63DRAFT_436407 [Microthyrium microscopicum]
MTIPVNDNTYPGSTFPDDDCESTELYAGKIAGTISVQGYCEEYRVNVLKDAALSHQTPALYVALPDLPAEKVVARLYFLGESKYQEDNEGILEILGISRSDAKSFGFGTPNTKAEAAVNRRKQIETICGMITRTTKEDPTRFPDLSVTRTFTNRLLNVKSTGSDALLRSSLYQMCLGIELLIRIRQQPAGSCSRGFVACYRDVVTPNISTMMLLARLCTHNVDINLREAGKDDPIKYSFYAKNHQRQIDGVVRFAEAIGWPYMDEARASIESAYTHLSAGTADLSWDVCDWLYGLSLPGKIFRHRLMAVLVDVSPTVRHLNAAPYFENGLCVKDNSYWPQNTALGRVLGGLRHARSVAGWIGPCPAPRILPNRRMTGWIRLNCRSIDKSAPLVRSTRSWESYGFMGGSGESTTQMIDAVGDIGEYIVPEPLAPRMNATPCMFKGINLELIPTPLSVVEEDTTLPKETYRASLDFEISREPVRYTLYTNPLFVSAPPCVGSHPSFRREAQMHLRDAVYVSQLKGFYPTVNRVFIINALGEGDEVVARAWCAETGRHAIVRRDVLGEECCFSCAVELASAEYGLGVNCVIWSR